MKHLKITLLLIVFLTSTTSILAQTYRPPQRGDRGYTPPSRDIQRSSTYEAKKDTGDIVDEKLSTYATALNLDEFKQVILKNILVKHYDKREVLRTDYAMKFGDKQDALLSLDDELHEELQSILSEDEISEFKKIQFSDEDSKKKKRQRKKRKKKNKDKKGTH